MDINADICCFLIISSNVKINVTKKVKTEDLWCVCGMPEFFDNIVGCENRKYAEKNRNVRVRFWLSALNK